MVEQQLRRVSSMSRGIGRESIGAAHPHTSTSKVRQPAWSSPAPSADADSSPCLAAEALSFTQSCSVRESLPGLRGVLILGVERERFA
jgi:predicted nucleic acid-binding Zn ribbon protein